MNQLRKNGILLMFNERCVHVVGQEKDWWWVLVSSAMIHLIP